MEARKRLVLRPHYSTFVVILAWLIRPLPQQTRTDARHLIGNGQIVDENRHHLTARERSLIVVNKGLAVMVLILAGLFLFSGVFQWLVDTWRN